MHVSIVIPNFNGASLLKQNIPFIRAAADFYSEKTNSIVDILITDDASEDNSKEVIRGQFPDILYITAKKNQGFSSNVNQGVKHAKGEIVVLLNTDVRPHKTFLISLLKHFSDDGVAGVGCLDLSIEHGKEKKRGRGIGRWERGFLFHTAGDTTRRDTLWVSGGSCAFRREVFEKVGGFYTVYNPFYWEDIDLSYRILKAGYQLIFEPESVVVHDHEEGSIRKQFTSHKITSVAYRNQILFVWINVTEPRLLASHFVWLPIHVIQSLLRGNVAFLQGLFAAYMRLPQAIGLRKKNEKLFRRDDSVVIYTAS